MESAHEAHWVSIADRLNPKRAGFDAEFQAHWANLTKKQRAPLLKADRKAIAALKARSQHIIHAFEADADDHCETSPIAYAHVAPLLAELARQIGKQPNDLIIYDPYFCAGSVARHLGRLGYTRVVNRNEDFYSVIASGAVPPHDVVLTNPPYSGDHVERLARWVTTNGKPFMLLLPSHFAHRTTYQKALGAAIWGRPDQLCFLCPQQRYHYWTPTGLRGANCCDSDSATTKIMDGRRRESSNANKRARGGHSNLQLGVRNSPYVSYWHIGGVAAVAAAATAEEAMMMCESGQRQELACCPWRLFYNADALDRSGWGTSFRAGKESALTQLDSKPRVNTDADAGASASASARTNADKGAHPSAGAGIGKSKKRKRKPRSAEQEAARAARAQARAARHAHRGDGAGDEPRQ